MEKINNMFHYQNNKQKRNREKRHFISLSCVRRMVDIERIIYIKINNKRSVAILAFNAICFICDSYKLCVRYCDMSLFIHFCCTRSNEVTLILEMQRLLTTFKVKEKKKSGNETRKKMVYMKEYVTRDS